MDLSVPYVDLAAQHQALRAELLEAVDKVLGHAHFVLGPEVGELEAEVAALCGTSEAVAVKSGTDALVLALQVLGVGPGDEVITVPNSFVASASAISLVKARPVFVDVGEDYNLDPAGLRAALTPRTRAILPVHLTGCPADMDPLLSFARAHGLFVVEDCAQAFGARYRGQYVGGLGDLGCFSLHPLKNLNACGDAGLITLNDPHRAARLRRMRNLGLVSRGVCGAWSGNSRLDTIQAAMLLVKLPHLPRWTARRRENAAFYRQALADLSEVWLPPVLPDREAVYHTFVIQADRRDALAEHLAARGVGTAIHYPIPIHLQPCAQTLGYQAGDFPRTEAMAARILSLPIYPELSDAQRAHVAEVIRGFYRAGGDEHETQAP
jgi:dTDP-4-amino-4,6-dideoxygalactose transaminase